MATADREPTSEPCRFPPIPVQVPQDDGLSLPPLRPFLLDSGDETLCAPAFGAFVDTVQKAWLARFEFGAGKPHLRPHLTQSRPSNRSSPLVCDICRAPGLIMDRKITVLGRFGFAENWIRKIKTKSPAVSPGRTRESERCFVMVPPEGRRWRARAIAGESPERMTARKSRTHQRHS